MKKNLTLFLLLIVMIGFSACNNQSTPVYKNELFLSSKEAKYGEIITTHPATNGRLFPTKENSTTKFEPHPDTYEEVMEKIENNQGIVVAGYAYGIREGHYCPDMMIDENTWQVESGSTRTNFKVKNVYYGECQNNDITIYENYVLREENHNIVFFTASGKSTCLKDDQLVLLYLLPINDEENSYYPVYKDELELGEGYDNYDQESYIRQLCAYYQGDPTMYQFPEDRQETLLVRQEDGTYVEETITVSGAVSPTETKTNSDLLKELLQKEDETAMMIRSALEFKVQIFPKGHIQNPIDIEAEKEAISKIILQQHPDSSNGGIAVK